MYLPTTIDLAAGATQDRILEILQKIEELPPFDPVDKQAWNAAFTESVVEPIKDLALHRLQHLEEIFGRTIALFGLGLYMFAYGFVVYALDQRYIQRSAAIFLGGHEAANSNVAVVVVQIVFMLNATLFMFLPFLLVKSLADVTTYCEELRSALNGLRLRDLAVDQDVLALERALDNIHGGGGMGFRLLGNLIDTSTLKTLASKLGAAAALAWPYLLSLQREADSTLHPCELDATQKERLLAYANDIDLFLRKGAEELLAAAGDGTLDDYRTCIYNVTLGPSGVE